MVLGTSFDTWKGTLTLKTTKGTITHEFISKKLLISRPLHRLTNSEQLFVRLRQVLDPECGSLATPAAQDIRGLSSVTLTLHLSDTESSPKSSQTHGPVSYTHLPPSSFNKNQFTPFTKLVYPVYAVWPPPR